MEDATIKVIVAMGCVTAVGILGAIYTKDAIIYSTVLAALSGLGGYELKNLMNYKATK